MGVQFYAFGSSINASRRLPQDNAGEAGMQEAPVAQAYLGTISINAH